MSENWFEEISFKGQMKQGYKVSRHLHKEQSKYQTIEVLETEAVGKLLLLDGKTMVSEADEFVYHEVMAHIPYMVCPKVERVLIIGGGDGGVVREFTRHKDIKEIQLVEIDERVIEVSKQFFPECTSGLSDSRVKILPQDGIQYVKDCKANGEKFDIIIVDSTDPEDFAAGLFTQEFYGNINDILTDHGIMMNQTENPFYDEYGLKSIYQNLKDSFKNVQSFNAPMIIYPGVFWTFGFSSKSTNALDLIESKIDSMREIQKTLKWYNMDWHKGAFALSNYQRAKLGL